MTLFDDLKDAIAPEWEAYTNHEFVQRLGEGTLPLQAFQDYLVQDYLFLIQFARANALAAYKSRRLADIREASDALSLILDETKLHRRLTERWGISLEELDAAPEKQGTVAYTRYVLDAGMSGDLLDLHIALAPCVIGYAEIGTALEPVLRANGAGLGERAGAVGGAGGSAGSTGGDGEAHPYAEWIEEYAGAEFQAGAAAAIARLDALSDGGAISSRRFAELVRVFRAATRLEKEFWQQGLDAGSSSLQN
ncbi:MAG: TenA family protein [Ancrocorticia sp.]|uniref:TenA family protein n=1 Tax=Ancrocorticia sp. TaxID=2593684 RepID=UPI003F8EE444